MIDRRAATSTEQWDVAVIGAGPAGSRAATGAARQGLRVLLLEREPMPRYKVCGCCLDAAALAALDAAGGCLEGIPTAGLRAARVGGWGRSVDLAMAGQAVIERSALDAALAAEARGAGATVHDCTRARVLYTNDEHACLSLLRHGRARQAHARLVLAADGLGGTTLARGRPRRARRLGVGAVVTRGADRYEPGTVHLAVGGDGYVGLVRLPDGRLNIAASLLASAVQRGGAGAAVQGTLAAAGWPPLSGSVEWRGTGALRSRARRVYAHRIVAVGDTGGFWEPFTGEGITWALESAARVQPLLSALAAEWDEDAVRGWARAHRRWVRKRQRSSRLLGWLAERPGVGRPTLAAMSIRPGLARWMAPNRLGSPLDHSR